MITRKIDHMTDRRWNALFYCLEKGLKELAYELEVSGIPHDTAEQYVLAQDAYRLLRMRRERSR